MCVYTYLRRFNINQLQMPILSLAGPVAEAH